MRRSENDLVTLIRPYPRLAFWLTNDPQRAVRLRKDGLTYTAIAETMGIKKYHVTQLFRYLGVKLPKSHRHAPHNTGASNPAWKGGRYIDREGYARVWTPQGHRMEHRVVMEAHLGRKLRSNEVVHHLNENKSDNRIENLELMTRSRHTKHHLPAMHKARYGRSPP